MQHHGSMYQGSPRVPFATTHYDTIGQDHLRLASHSSVPSTHDESSHAGGDETFSNTGPSLFLNMNGTSVNPLFSQDRQFLNSYAQQLSDHSLEPSSFSAISHDIDYGQLTSGNRDQRQIPSSSVKMEAHMCDGLENHSAADLKGVGFGSKMFWGPSGSETDLALHDNLHPEEVDI